VGVDKKTKRNASSEWRPFHFISISFIVTALSIIFLFAMRYVFNRIESSATLNNEKFDYRVAAMGGMLIRSTLLEISESEAPSEFVDSIERQVFALKDLPVWSVNVNRLRAEMESLSWISSAHVKRVWPDEIRVNIHLAAPRFVVRGTDSWALVGDNGRFLFIARDFQGDWVKYPVVFGLENVIRGEAAELNRSLVQEQKELADLAQFSKQLKKALVVEPERFDVQYDEWVQSAIFTAHWKDSKSREFVVSVRSIDWADRLTNLQFVLSDLQSKNFSSARIRGEFDGKWFVDLKGYPGNG